jgi:hypothetical protein
MDRRVEPTLGFDKTDITKCKKDILLPTELFYFNCTVYKTL